MAETADLNSTIVETLYSEALALADRARDSFDLSGRMTAASESDDLARIALSCEALRTTTRMMHSIAWLLNQRAHLAGELSELQLRRHGRLPPDRDDGKDQLAQLPQELVELVDSTHRFYARIKRLDDAWRGQFSLHPSAIHGLRDRLGQAVGRL